MFIDGGSIALLDWVCKAGFSDHHVCGKTAADPLRCRDTSPQSYLRIRQKGQGKRQKGQQLYKDWRIMGNRRQGAQERDKLRIIGSSSPWRNSRELPPFLSKVKTALQV